MSLGEARARPADDWMSESEKPFTVKDRRHFTPDGRVREEPEAPSESETEAPEAQATGTGSEAPFPSDTSSRPATTATAEPDGGRRPTAGGSSPGPAETPVDLGQFVLSLGAQAGMLLSGQGLPEDADAAEALAGARAIISILEMLEKKTQGNRTDDETRILEGLLYELRMAYVETSRGGGS